MKKNRKKRPENNDAKGSDYCPIQDVTLYLQGKNLTEICEHCSICDNKFEERRIQEGQLKNTCRSITKSVLEVTPIYRLEDLQKIDKKYFPHGGFYKVEPSKEGCCHFFSNYYSKMIGGPPKGKHFLGYTVPPQIKKYEEHLTFEEVIANVKRDIDSGCYDQWGSRFVIEKKVEDLKNEHDYLGKRASKVWQEDYEETMDLLTIRALYTMPEKLFHSRDRNINFLKQHLEKRLASLNNINYIERISASGFLERLLAKRDGNRKDFPSHFYVSGLVHFLLPIAWNLYDKYLLEFPDHKKRIDRPTNPIQLKRWRKKVKNLDPRLIRLEDESELHHLINKQPKVYIEQHLLPDLFNVTSQKIKSRIITTEKNARIN